MEPAGLEGAATIFSQALDQPADQRGAFLARACAGAADLLAEVTALLEAHARAGPFMAGPTAGAEAGSAPDGEGAGARVGPYTLLEPIGEGGFGRVFMAEQREPMVRRVALKIIKLGMDTRQVIARFEAERQALAMMDHPSIARVLDAGATALGRPYFVMELVRGEPITAYCDAHALGIRERLELFVQVCHAVQHAHQKGIIHRDLKPGNVLVTKVDSRPVPKVIDFGIAKATTSRLTEKTLFTEHRAMIGTPEYMSPEQADAHAADIDTRSDVYALGVLLYELLTGVTPLDAGVLRSAAFDEMQRMIREAEAPKPSTRLSGPAAERIAARRRVEPGRLQALVRGDLDWVVMKCLEKDRSRRYETADGLARDVVRYLEGEPVAAAPPSRIYRWRKLARRNRGAVGAGLAIAAVLTAGAAVSIRFGLHEAAARRMETEQRRLADRRAVETERVATFQAAQLRQLRPAAMGQRLRDLLTARAAEGLARDGIPADEAPTSRETLESLLARVNTTDVALRLLETTVFDPALAAIETEFADQPLLRARLLQATAETMRELGLLEGADAPQAEALAIRRQELGDNHRDTMAASYKTAQLLEARGRLDEAEALLRSGVARDGRVLPADDPDALARRATLGLLLQNRGRVAEAEPHLIAAMEGYRRALGEDDPSTLTAVNNMGVLRRTQGRLAEAQAFLERVLAGRRRVLGEDDPQTLSSINNVGMIFHQQGRLVEAEPYLRDAMERRRRVLGDDHPETLRSIANMGFALKAQRRLKEAEEYSQEALDRRRHLLGEDHPDTLQSLINVAGLVEAQGRLEEAAGLLRDALERSRRVLGPDDPTTTAVLNNLGNLLLSSGDYSSAETFLKEALEQFRRRRGREHPDTLTVAGNIGALLFKQKRYADAEPYCRESLSGLLERLGPDHPQVGNMRLGLGKALLELKRYPEAETELEEAERVLRSAQGVSPGLRRDCLEVLIRLYAAWEQEQPGRGQGDKSAPWKAKLDAAADPR